MLADETTLHTSGKDIMQIRSNMQDSLDQVTNWCDNNHIVINPIKTNMVINPIKTKSMTIATRQKHQLLPLPLGSRSKRGENLSSVRTPSFRYNHRQ